MGNRQWKTKKIFTSFSEKTTGVTYKGELDYFMFFFYKTKREKIKVKSFPSDMIGSRVVVITSKEAK